jgi:hypothetical protein
MRLFIVLLTTITAVGCVTYQPLPQGYSGPTALIIDTSNSISSTRVHFYQLTHVDGRQVQSSSVRTSGANHGQGFAMDVIADSRLVPAGDVVLAIEGRTHVAAPILALGGNMHLVQGEISVHLEENVGYYVRGRLNKDYSVVWLEDNNGNIVSEKIEKGTRPDE